jgi:hypothetical protein
VDKLKRRTVKYMYLERIIKQLDDDAKGIIRYVELFFDFLVSEKKKNQSTSRGYDIIKDCNHSGSELTNPLSNAQRMGFQIVVEIWVQYESFVGHSQYSTSSSVGTPARLKFSFMNQFVSP